MKLTTVTNVSLDGVTQGHRRIEVGTRREGRGPEEDGSDGFERFGWGPPLLDHRLFDQIVLLTYPVVVGQGTRLFPATGADMGLELVDVRSTPKGLTIQTYRTTGRPQYETT